MPQKDSMIKVTFQDGSIKEVKEGVTLAELSRDFEKQYKSDIVAAKVNNDFREINYGIYNSCNIKFIDLTDEDGMRIYRRSLKFLMYKAFYELFPGMQLVIGHSISKGLYFEVKGKNLLSNEDIIKVENKMRELVQAKIPFVKRVMSIEEARALFEKKGRLDRVRSIEHRAKPYVTIYECGGVEDYFFGYMVPDTSYLKNFKLIHYHSGLIMLFPDKVTPNSLPEFKEQRKLFNIFAEYKKWNRILGVTNVGELNETIKKGSISEFIRISEALHEKKIAQIADLIAHNENKKSLILIAGPSSSGKTTFAHRLAIQLKVNGLKPVTISMDDYFVNREQTPKDEKGDFDFESIDAIDLELFNKHLAQLIKGEEIEIPTFNFQKGCRENFGHKLKICEDNIVIVEGIHGLNERVSDLVAKGDKFKIYISALTSLNIDEHNRIPTTDTRFIRRIVRDYQFRGSSAENTIKVWPSVRRGEEKNIFPYQEEADVMFNSSLIYELGVLKKMAEQLLSDVSIHSPFYSEAKRLFEFLRNFLEIEQKEIPSNSIIKEFIGGSCFYS